jgi:signal peptidase I
VALNKKKTKGGIGETIRTLIYAVLIAVVIRSVAYEPFNIPSGSMRPTLLIGDYLFVSKFSYGYSRYSLPFSLPLFQGRVFDTPPKRGDVAVFKTPTDNATDFIKRIIGLPGDRVQVRDGVVYLNGEPLQRVRVEDFLLEGRNGRVVRIPQYVETLPSGRSYRTLDEGVRSADNTRVVTVTEGHYFVMGDNRDNSADSRFAVPTGVGLVPAENLVGRAEVLFFSTNGGARWWEVWRWPSATRASRLFQSVRASEE